MKEYRSKLFLIGYAKSVIAGGITALLHLLFTYILTEWFQVYYLYSANISFFITSLVNFTLQRVWVFRGKGSERILAECTKYFVVVAVNLMMNTYLMHLFTEKFHIWYLASQAVIIFILSAISYLIVGRFVFTKRLEGV